MALDLLALLIGDPPLLSRARRIGNIRFQERHERLVDRRVRRPAALALLGLERVHSLAAERTVGSAEAVAERVQRRLRSADHRPLALPRGGLPLRLDAGPQRLLLGGEALLLLSRALAFGAGLLLEKLPRLRALGLGASRRTGRLAGEGGKVVPRRGVASGLTETLGTRAAPSR